MEFAPGVALNAQHLIWMHNHELPVKNLSDDDIANIIFRSAKAAREQRRTAKENLAVDGDGVRFMTLKSKPKTVDEFLKMPGHARPPRLNFSNIGEIDV